VITFWPGFRLSRLIARRASPEGIKLGGWTKMFSLNQSLNPVNPVKELFGFKMKHGLFWMGSGSSR
jgi:hypothetical protein